MAPVVFHALQTNGSRPRIRAGEIQTKSQTRIPRPGCAGSKSPGNGKGVVVIQQNLFGDPIQEAVDFIRRHEPPNGYSLAFSGGKDSILLKSLADRAGVRYRAHYACTGIDPPEVVKFIREEHPEVKFLFPKHSFFKELKTRGYPTRKIRWCCDFLKKAPAKDVGPHRLIGIRAEESAPRAKRPRVAVFKKDIWLYKPVFYINEAVLWEYLDSEKIPYPSLYDEGFSRLGCVVCPFICSVRVDGTNPRLERAKARWPGVYKAFESAMRRLWEDREWWIQ